MGTWGSGKNVFVAFLQAQLLQLAEAVPTQSSHCPASDVLSSSSSEGNDFGLSLSAAPLSARCIALICLLVCLLFLPSWRQRLN